MLKCTRCGIENPLGRVFCGSCGSKLDLTGVTGDAIAEEVRPSFVELHYRKAVGVLAVLAVAVVALAFWPNTAPLGEKGTPASPSRTTGKMGVIQTLVSGRSVTVEISEADINGYLSFSRLRKTGIDSCTVRLVPQAFVARLVKPLGSWTAGKFSLSPKISFEVRCVPVGRQLLVSSASIGHLPAVGPLKRMAVGPFLKLFAGGKEAEWLKAASEIKCDMGKVSITATR